MDDSPEDEAGKPRERRQVTELDMLESLNRSLWEVERRRVEESVETR